eukprot:1196296-Prorocentrum_minimum.AAC.2
MRSMEGSIDPTVLRRPLRVKRMRSMEGSIDPTVLRRPLIVKRMRSMEGPDAQHELIITVITDLQHQLRCRMVDSVRATPVECSSTTPNALKRKLLKRGLGTWAVGLVWRVIGHRADLGPIPRPCSVARLPKHPDGSPAEAKMHIWKMEIHWKIVQLWSDHGGGMGGTSFTRVLKRQVAGRIRDKPRGKFMARTRLSLAFDFCESQC